ncbi:Major Facilitator Superfamily transporter [Actinobacteria bacterium IMCC26207]|nr:Major Facilitator Superfamily transporter [Actinobacteria bacterium IMCC26207]
MEEPELPAPKPNSSEAVLDEFARHRPWFIRATILSGLGSSMAWLATSYVIYANSGSVAISALVTVVSSVPSLLLGGAATSLSGKYSAAKLYVWGGIALGLVGFVPVFFSLAGELATRNLLLWYLLIGIISGLTAPAGAMVTRFLAPADAVPEFNASITKAKSISSVIGLLLGGAIYAALGPTWIYLFSALTFFAPVLAVLPVTGKAPQAVAQGKLREIVHLRKTNPGLRAVFVACVISCFGGSFSITLPAVAAEIGSGAWILSVLQTAYVVGGLVVVVAVKRFHLRVKWGQMQRLCVMVAGLGLVGMAFVTKMNASPGRVFMIVVLLLLPVGLAFAIDISVLAALVQVHSPEKSRGSVLTAYHMVPMLVFPVAQEFIGFMSDQFSLAAGFWICGGVLLIVLPIGKRMGIGAAIDVLDDSDAPPEVTAVVPRSVSVHDRHMEATVDE